jgi:hypothetical protein
MYKRLNLLIVALFVAVVGVGCGKTDKSPASKREQQVKAVLESTEVQAKKVALENALKALRLPNTGGKEMLQEIEDYFESLKKRIVGGAGIKKEALNDAIVELDQAMQTLKDCRSNLVSLLTNVKRGIPNATTLKDYIDVINKELILCTIVPAYLQPLLRTMLGGKWTDAEKRQAPAASVKSCFKSVDAVLDVHDALTDLFSEVLAGLKNIKG